MNAHQIRVGLVTEKGSNNRNQNQGADMHHQNAGGPGMAGGPPGQGGPPGMHGGPRNPNQSGMMRPDSLEDSGESRILPVFFLPSAIAHVGLLCLLLTRAFTLTS